MRCLVRPRNGRWTIAAIAPWTTTIGGSVHSTATLPWYPATTSTPTRPAMLSQRYRSLLSSAVQSRLHAMLERHREILAELQSSNSSSGSGAYTSQSTAKELQSLAGLTSLYETYMGLEDEKKSYQDLQKEATSTDNTDDDDDLAEECASELDRIAKAREVLETKLIDALLQSEDDDDAHDATSDAILEIRAGTGGDEAALFAGELWDAYAEAARANRWKVDVLSVSRTDLGGVKAGTLSISGRPTMRLPDDVDETGPVFAPYGAFKYESGVHRVQRVPVNDNKLQTSACSIAVLPDLNDAAVGALAMSDLKIDTMRSSGAGGQHVNTTDSAVRMTHLPTGITVSMQDERSQHQNREKALKVITARVRDHERTLAMEKSGASRSSLMGAGDRSERIRTFNFPQDRISDHRCKETRHGIAALLKGGRDSENLVSAFLPHLRSMRRQEQLEVLEEKHIAKVNKK